MKNKKSAKYAKYADKPVTSKTPIEVFGEAHYAEIQRQIRAEKRKTAANLRAETKVFSEKFEGAFPDALPKIKESGITYKVTPVMGSPRKAVATFTCKNCKEKYGRAVRIVSIPFSLDYLTGEFYGWEKEVGGMCAMWPQENLLLLLYNAFFKK